MQLEVFISLVLATGGIALFSLWLAYRRSRDTFHPMIYLGLLCIAFYCWIPLNLVFKDPTGLLNYLSVREVEYVQLINLLSVTALCFGVFAGSGKLRWTPYLSNGWVLPPIICKRLDRAAFVLGFIGLLSFIYNIVSVGGLEVAYGKAYGGGWSDIGYLREAPILTVPALLWLMASHIHRSFSRKEIILILAFASPNLIHGLLGARRGPTALILVTLVVSWYLVRSRRPKLMMVVTGGVCIGLLMLFLVSNRGSLYLGSESSVKGIGESSEFLSKATASNEFIYAGGTMLDRDARDGYFWGRRYFVVFFIRPFPRFLWPTKYDDMSKVLGIPSLEDNMGLGSDSLEETVGWVGPKGAASGLIADMWIEFWWFSLLAMYCIGWLYGRAWRKALIEGGLWIPNYVIMTALSIYLITQTLEAMAFRYLLATAGSWLIWRYGSKGLSMQYLSSYAASESGEYDT